MSHEHSEDDANRNAQRLHIIKARNSISSTKTDISQSTLPGRTYHNTGTQTLPPRDATAFKIVHGKEPTDEDLAKKTGLAALGRFKSKQKHNTHDLVYGRAYNVQPLAKVYVTNNSSFQTLDAPKRQMALLKAKAKASFLSKKCNGIVAANGVEIYAETNDNNILHSEQHSYDIRVDANGQASGNFRDDTFLPNLWARDDVPVDDTMQQMEHLVDSEDKVAQLWTRSAGSKRKHADASAEESSPKRSRLQKGEEGALHKHVDVIIEPPGSLLDPSVHIIAPSPRPSSLVPEISLESEVEISLEVREWNCKSLRERRSAFGSLYKRKARKTLHQVKEVEQVPTGSQTKSTEQIVEHIVQHNPSVTSHEHVSDESNSMVTNTEEVSAHEATANVQQTQVQVIAQPEKRKDEEIPTSESEKPLLKRSEEEPAATSSKPADTASRKRKREDIQRFVPSARRHKGSTRLESADAPKTTSNEIKQTDEEDDPVSLRWKRQKESHPGNGEITSPIQKPNYDAVHSAGERMHSKRNHSLKDTTSHHGKDPSASKPKFKDADALFLHIAHPTGPGSRNDQSSTDRETATVRPRIKHDVPLPHTNDEEASLRSESRRNGKSTKNEAAIAQARSEYELPPSRSSKEDTPLRSLTTSKKAPEDEEVPAQSNIRKQPVERQTPTSAKTQGAQENRLLNKLTNMQKDTNKQEKAGQFKINHKMNNHIINNKVTNKVANKVTKSTAKSRAPPRTARPEVARYIPRALRKK